MDNLSQRKAEPEQPSGPQLAVLGLYVKVLPMYQEYSVAYVHVRSWLHF